MGSVSGYPSIVDGLLGEYFIPDGLVGVTGSVVVGECVPFLCMNESMVCSGDDGYVIMVDGDKALALKKSFDHELRFLLMSKRLMPRPLNTEYV